MKALRFSDRLRAFFTRNDEAADSFLEELEDALLEGDVGPKIATEIGTELRSVCRTRRLNDLSDMKTLLIGILTRKLKAADSALTPGRLNIVLLLGVNGVGKTTTAAKLANWYRSNAGVEPILAACDTFRAAAIDQLKIHGDRLGLRVVAHKIGGDPAAVLFDAIETARVKSLPLIIADSAGRMHTKSGLVEELKKIDRVVNMKAENAAYRKFLVIDATTGRNALAQASIFNEAVGIDGVVLAKLDSTAKGGAVFSLFDELGIAPAFVCDGEGYDDIALFDPERYAREFVGLD